MTEWRTSSQSQEAGACVAIHHTLAKIQDTKNPGVTIAGDIRALVNWLTPEYRSTHPSN